MSSNRPTQISPALWRQAFPSLLLALLWSMPDRTFAGGSGLNVAVVVNQASSNSVALGNYYCERRQVPPVNLVRINWPGANTEWSSADFTNVLLNPLLAAINSRGLSNQIDYVVLSMDLPYRVSEAGQGANSTTASLFYGFKPDSRDPYTCPLAVGSTNSYALSESIFRTNKPDTAPGWSFLTLMITSDTLDRAKAIVDNGVAADGTLPTDNLILLEETSDGARNVRHSTFDDAIFNLRLRTNTTFARTNSDLTTGITNLLGFQTGLANFSLTGTTFVPGAMADSLTSFAGAIFEGGFGQTTLLEFINAGATGSYGTVIEPCNYLEKFPAPMNYFFQARGFSLGECLYLAVENPYEGLMVGEPLAAPFRQLAQAAWTTPASNAVLSGTTNLSLHANSTTSARPVQQVDLFVDGKFLQTLTNIPPSQNNSINVTIKGRSMSYTVPANATIKSVAAGLTGELNSFPNPTLSGANGFQFGDRIELRATSSNTAGSTLTTSVSTAKGSAAALTTFITAARADFLDSIAIDPQSHETLKARNHLYITAGTTNLDLTFPFNTTTLADGFHELTAVVYEGTHVRTQTRATVPVIVQNTALNTALTLVGADALTAVETNFSVQVTANVTNIALIELFCTGGRLAAATNQSSATFGVSGQLLGVGLHPFNAVITTTGGQHYRTPTTFVRLTGRETEVVANVLWNLPPLLTWPGVTGRRYDIFSTDDLGTLFGLRDTVTASNSLLNLWLDPAISPGQTQRFYRVGVSQ